MNTASKLSKGLTLIEILVSVSILIVVLGLGLFVTFDAYRGYSFRSERSVLISALEKARSRSMANLHQTTHGVCFSGSKIIIFRGSVCNLALSTNETIPAGASTVIVGMEVATPVVFDRLSGKLSPEVSPESAERTISITDGIRAPQEIKINNEGTINW